MLQWLTWAQSLAVPAVAVLSWIAYQSFRGGQISSDVLARLHNVEIRTGTPERPGTIETQINTCNNDRLALRLQLLEAVGNIEALERRMDTAGAEMSKLATMIQGIETRMRAEFQPLSVAAVLTREYLNRFDRVEKDVGNLYALSRGESRGKHQP